MKAEVKLEGLDFYAYHGFYEQEQKIGNRFSVDVTVFFDYSEARKDDLSKTIDYQTLYAAVKEEMAIPSKLLETVAAKVIDRIFTIHTSISNVEVSVSKFNPPIGGQCEKAKVTLSKSR